MILISLATIHIIVLYRTIIELMDRVELNIMHAIFLSCKLLTPIDDSSVGGVGDQVRRISLFVIVYHVNLRPTCMSSYSIIISTAILPGRWFSQF